MYVRSWNKYNIDGAGKLIIGMELKFSNVSDALNEAERRAKSWNARHKRDIESRVNMITCNGFIRVIS